MSVWSRATVLHACMHVVERGGERSAGQMDETERGTDIRERAGTEKEDGDS